MLNYKTMTAKEAIRTAKEESGLTAEQIAQHLGVSVSLIRRYLKEDDNYFRGCQLNNDAISFQLPLTWNLAKSAIVRSTISRVLDTTIDFLLKRANQCLCLPLFCSRYTVCDLL